jgi:UDPglucose--hexose-1-phosphate uridylyltransferase
MPPPESGRPPPETTNTTKTIMTAKTSFDPEDHPHRRQNALTGQWVLVSPHRTRRPWLGQTETAPRERRPAYDPACALCPGNVRASGAVNPAFDGTFVFDNDFGALLPDTPAGAVTDGTDDDPLFRGQAVSGLCRVVCFSPRHDLTLAEMAPAELAAVVDTWAAETVALGARFPWVQVFENKGAVMGCSNPHPHGQIWASSALPNDAAVEDRHQRAYADAHGTPLLLDYARRELELGDRVVHRSGDWLAVVPYWAAWPYETLILPLSPLERLPDLAPAARLELASFLSTLLAAYDRLFDVSFPYSMGWHGAPFGVGATSHWQLHAHVFPPLLRSATIKKFMVGYEMLAEPQRDLTPEQAARRLRDLAAAGTT